MITLSKSNASLMKIFFKAFGTQVCEGLVWDPPPGLGGTPHLAHTPSEDDPTGLGTPDVKPSAQSLCLTPLLQNLKTSIFFVLLLSLPRLVQERGLASLRPR